MLHSTCLHLTDLEQAPLNTHFCAFLPGSAPEGRSLLQIKWGTRNTGKSSLFPPHPDLLEEGFFFFFSSKYCKNISKSAPDTFQEFTCHLLKNINDAPVWDVVVPWFIEQKQRETKATSAWLPKTDRRITHGRMEHCSITLLGQALVWWPHLCKTGRKKTQLLPTSCSSLWTPFQTTDTKITDTWTACRQPCELTPTHCNTQWDISS